MVCTFISIQRVSTFKHEQSIVFITAFSQYNKKLSAASLLYKSYRILYSLSILESQLPHWT